MMYEGVLMMDDVWMMYEWCMNDAGGGFKNINNLYKIQILSFRLNISFLFEVCK